MGRIVVITGTRKGIGKDLAEHYLGLGDTVAGCSRGESGIEHENYTHHCLDVADEKAVVAMVRATARKHGRIDALLNNAGIASMNPLTLTPYSTAKDIFSTNFYGTFLFCRETSKVMVQKNRGRIVNFATVATPLRLEGEAMYAASKAAVANMTEILARELGSFGITVNAVGPTPVPTDLIKNVPQEKIDSLLARQSIRRLGSVKDIINVCDFLLAEQSDFITGQVIYLGGVNG